MKCFFRGVSIFIALYIILPCLASGQSAIGTLVRPFGARSTAMGDIGTASGDDGSVLFFNPAGLCVPNERWRGGSGSTQYGPLVPAFHFPGLWQTALAANYQDSSFWFQPGIFWNFTNMGDNTWTDELGREIGLSHSYEEVYALGAGFDFKDIGVKNHYFGLTLKLFKSALAPGVGLYHDATAYGYALDAGYLWTIGHCLKFGATLMNMGPSVSYIDPNQRDPLPFTINVALAYKNVFPSYLFNTIGVVAELRLDREAVKNHPDQPPDPFYTALWTDILNDKGETLKLNLQRIREHLGGEITFAGTISLRSGLLIGPVEELYELRWGAGLHIFNHFSLDFGTTVSPSGFMRGFAKLFDPDKEGASGAYDGQWQITATLDRALFWSNDDFR